MKEAYMAIDAHARHCVLAVMDETGQLCGDWRFATTEAELIRHVDAVKAPTKRMPADDDGVNSSDGINREVIDVVDDENTNPANFHRSGLRQPLSPDASINIPPNCRDGSNLCQLIQHLWLAYIASMND